ncbi:MAG: carboxypeptidase regulatory-like domain-containing protein [Janthinobacterium lividum]
MKYSFSRLCAVPVATAAVVLFSGLSAHAQQNTGAVRGEVRDAQGAKVKDATVTLTSLGTKIVRTAKTNDAGIYQFGAVDPGDYKVVVTSSGFKTYEVGSATVELAATATIDATLQVGGAGEVVEVTAAEPLLDTASASGGQLFSKQQIQDLPNLGRNPFIFEKLDSNVTTTGDPRYVRAEDQTGLSQISVAGAPIGANNYVVDGIPISRSDGGVTFIPSPEAVSDAKVQANSYDAEVGRTGGGVFNTSLTSGSAQYHGTLYGETRQTPWSANNWFNAPNRTTGLKSATPDATTYLYAGAFGGPLPFMKKIKFLDNTFFWVTEEGYRQAQFYPSSSATTYVPTAAERNGDFSGDLLPGSLNPASPDYGKFVVFDPNSPLVTDKSSPRFGQRTTPISDGGVINKIPAGLISPTGKAILNAFPAANLNGSNYSAGVANFSQLNTFKTRSDMYSGKLEHTFAPWWTAGISYVHLATQEPSGFLLGGIVAENANKLLRYNDATAINNTFTLNPTTLLTVGYGFNRYYSASFQFSNGYDLASLGFPGSYISKLQSKTFPAVAFTNVTNGRGLGGANGTIQEQASKNLVVGLSKTINRNNVKIGYVYRLLKFNNGPNSVPGFTFNGQYTSLNPASPTATTALAFADTLLGTPSNATYTLNSGNFLQIANYHAVYLQDDVRLNSKLTVNVGIRYEYELGQREANNRYNVGFDPNATSTLPTISNGNVALKGGLLFAGQNGAPIHCCAQSHIKFSPRVGVAYQVAPKMVIHAGFGVFYAPVGLAFAGSGYAQTTTYAPPTPTPGDGFSTAGSGSFLSNPFPGGFVAPSGSSLGSLTGVGSSLPLTGTLAGLHRRYPLVQQYSFDIQQDLPLGINFKLSYVGAHSRNIFNSGNINQLDNGVMSTYVGTGTALNANVTNTLRTASINGYAATGIVANANVARGQLLLPYPQFGAVNVSLDNGFSRYNSLAVKVQKRLASGFTLLSTYTWSANWDNLWSAGSQIYSTYGPQDIYNPKAERSRALNNVPNRFTAAVSYDLPFGRGKRFLGNVPWYVNEVVGGWQINDEWTLQNGTPLSIQQTNVSTGNGVTGIGGSYQRPNLVGDAHTACLSGRPQSRLGSATVYGNIGQPQYLNSAAFSPARPYTYGNAPRMLPCQGPGSNNSDISINKNFKITEKVNAQFRAEALNAFNTPQFGNPTLTYVVNSTGAGTSPTAAAGSAQTLGNVTSQINYSRIIQLGGRISF